MSSFEAAKIAQEEGVDLILINENANPPVVRIKDYGKFLYDAVRFSHKSYCIYLKCAYAMLTGLGLFIASELSTFKNAKFIACLTFGYVCFRVWDKHKPAKEIGDCWFYI
jgi:hypothetical protein